MLSVNLAETRSIGGFVRASLINARLGMDVMMERLDESETADLDTETAEMSKTYSKRLRDREQLGCSTENIDMIIRDDERYHLMRSVDGMPDVMLHVVLDRKNASLLRARTRLASITRNISESLRGGAAVAPALA
ncbi:MAG: hypothetical protein ABI459_11050 [Deltaproteobacteria bacterium]